MPNRQRRFTAQERATLRQQAADLYGQGCTIRSIAAQFDCAYATAREFLLEAGVTLRARGGGIRKAGA